MGPWDHVFPGLVLTGFLVSQLSSDQQTLFINIVLHVLITLRMTVHHQNMAQAGEIITPMVFFTMFMKI